MCLESKYVLQKVIDVNKWYTWEYIYFSMHASEEWEI